MAFDHGRWSSTPYPARRQDFYTNIGFALTPREFALSTLRDIYSAALGHQVDATNLQRVLERRNVSPAPAPRRGPDAAVASCGAVRFNESRYRVTDELRRLRPPVSPTGF